MQISNAKKMGMDLDLGTKLFRIITALYKIRYIDRRHFYVTLDTMHQWCRQGDACTQSIHQCTLYCDVYLAHVHVLVAVDLL